MDTKDRTTLEHIGFVFLGNLLLVITVFLLVVWRLGWRQTVRQTWEWTLVVSVYFGVAFTGMVVLASPCFNWVTLHTHFDARQIDAEDIRIEKFIRPYSVVFSNGESRSVGFLPYLVFFSLAFSWWGLCVWITMRIARRFAPSVWAEMSHQRDRAP